MRPAHWPAHRFTLELALSVTRVEPASERVQGPGQDWKRRRRNRLSKGQKGLNQSCRDGKSPLGSAARLHGQFEEHGKSGPFLRTILRKRK